MAHLIGIFRLGRDAEVRYMPGGEAVANLSLAFNFGKKDSEGKRPSQWIDAGLWGERAEKLSQYLLRGTAIYAILDDPHIEVFKRRDQSEAARLVARVQTIEFVGGREGRSEEDHRTDSTPAPRQQPPASRPAPQAKPSAGGSGFDDMDDDIPF